MKVIKSSPVNINKMVMGRITKEPLSRFKRRDSIFATNDLNVKHVYSAESAPVIEFKKKEQK